MDETTSGTRPRRGGRRTLTLVGMGLFTLLVLAAGWLYGQLRGSLAQLDGVAVLKELDAPVLVERDALGIPLIHGGDRLDVARATGFIHAQERFFQMDLLRRTAAGELATLFGRAALELDRAHRLHRFRHRASQALAAASPEDRTLIAAYTAGVNAGLAALAAPPFEYRLLRLEPTPWRPEDTPLVVYAMYLTLQGRQWLRESTRGLLHDQLPPELATFLDPPGTEWDAPLRGGPLTSAPLPGPKVFDLRHEDRAAALPRWPQAVRKADARSSLLTGIAEESEAVSGSNNWAVAGRLTAHGGALLANDMHLALRVPNIWYRATLVYPDTGGERRVTGITLPGAPAIVVGSNGHIAWGFTNSEGDWADLVILEPGADHDHYRTPAGPRTFTHIRETLNIKDEPPEMLEILETVWGPVVDRDHRGRRRALRWVAHEPRAFNLDLMALERSETVEAALDRLNRTGVPEQNVLVAGADGRIAWTLSGPIPRRFGHAGRVPSSWADGTRGWSDWLETAEYPRIVDPPNGRLWTANGRVVDGAWLDLLGDGGYALGARARQIRDRLQSAQRFDEADFLTLQLDDRALFLQRWRDLLLTVLTPETTRAIPRREDMRQQVAAWSGRAAVDSIGYRLVRAFRLNVRERVFAPLTATCLQADRRFDYTLIRQHEGPLWQLLTQRPPHLLDPRYPDWSALLLDAADAALEELTRDGRSLAQSSWGEYNTIRIRHPFSRSLPWLGSWLDMPTRALPGDFHMPRVQTPHNGASERLAIAPGRETRGILHMPGGQGGHPLSPFYRAGFEAWADGQPSAFLPGPARYRLILRPEAR